MSEVKFYDQIDGVAMGSPFTIGLVLSNLFIGYYEQQGLQSLEEFEVILYRRYVDDTICFF